MNAADKERFVRELAANVVDEIVANIPKMPEEWDGHELRRYMADRFNEASITLRRERTETLYRRRLRDYRNEVITRGL